MLWFLRRLPAGLLALAFVLAGCSRGALVRTGAGAGPRVDRSAVFYVKLVRHPAAPGAGPGPERSTRALARAGTLPRFGRYVLRPEHPDFDRARAAHRAGRPPEEIPDLALIYQLRFERSQPVTPVVEALAALPAVAWAEPATDLERLALDAGEGERPSPGDEPTPEAGQWELDRVGAAQARRLAQGRTGAGAPILVGIFDSWQGARGAPTEVHPDLGFDAALGGPRLTVHPDARAPERYGERYGGHGLRVASVAGAITGNGSGMASLGQGVRLVGYWYFLHNLPAMVDAGVRVLSISALYTDRPRLREYVRYALASGVVVVAAAGNYEALAGGVNYPAALAFDDLGAQVIAVTATDSSDRAVAAFVRSPGTDPLHDAERAFIDVAAPGVDVRVLDTHARGAPQEGYAFTTRRATGTSVAAPMVSALAALLLSADPGLTVQEVYHLITYYADKVGPYAYDAQGWCRELGYGRINAARSLEALVEAPRVRIEQAAGPAEGDEAVYHAVPVAGIPPFTYTWTAQTGAGARVIGHAPTSPGAAGEAATLHVEVTDARGRTARQQIALPGAPAP